VPPTDDLVRPVLKLLHEHAVEAVVIGGIAAVALGVPLTTFDVDVCYDPDPANIERLISALRAVSARLPVARMSDEEARALPFQIETRTFRDNEMLTLRTDVGTLDLLKIVPGVGDYSAVGAASVEAAVFGIRFLALDLPALVANKRAAARARDIAALPLIEATLRARELEEKR